MSPHAWQKSSHCAQGEACVHVGTDRSGSIGLTESGDPTGAILRTTPAALRTLLRTLKGDRPHG
ncbi:DUF397 domain-containing protein [Streptomyces sp. NPDC048428]|uniref:DUF397 domain-containing protein n=1 Tax=Streptomyces sp. NPDC048428 TaxID=3154503 RepID=UPI003415665B